MSRHRLFCRALNLDNSIVSVRSQRRDSGEASAKTHRKDDGERAKDKTDRYRKGRFDTQQMVSAKELKGDHIMKKNTINNYKEVTLDSNGHEEDRSYRNRLTRVFQYEYALYLTVSDLFESVRCRSMCVDSLKLYFMELGHKKENDENYAGNRRKNTREDLLEEMKELVSRDVIGHVSFPMMHICSAEVRTIPEENGTHSFVFSDGIYGFKIHLDIQGKGYPTKIEVTKSVRTVPGDLNQ